MTFQLVLVYVYGRHFSPECEPNGYLGFRTARNLQPHADLQVVFQRPDPVNLGGGGGGSGPHDVSEYRTYIAAQHRAFEALLLKEAGEAVDWKKRSTNLCLRMETPTGDISGTICQYAFTALQTADEGGDDQLVTKDGNAMLVERRTDDLVFRSWDMLDAVEHKQPYWIGHSHNGKFSVAVDLNHSALLMLSDGKTTLVDTLAHLLHKSSVQIRAHQAQTRQSLAHTGRITLQGNQVYYRVGRRYAWSRDMMRTFNNSYVALPSADYKLVLPGETYLRVNGNFGGKQLPMEFFAYHAMVLARDRLGVQAEAVSRMLKQQQQSLSSAERELLVEWFADFISWPVRGVAQYLNDEIDRCIPKARSSGARRQQRVVQQQQQHSREKCASCGSSASGRLSSKSRQQLSREEEGGGGGESKGSLGALPQQQQHAVESTDQFKGPWDGAFPHLDADDCESLKIAVYALVLQFRLAVLAARRQQQQQQTTPVERLFGDMVVNIYVPVMLTCSIHRSMHDRMAFKSDDASEQTGLGNRSLVFDATKAGLQDPRLICHVLLLMIPRQRLHRWLSRGRDYMALAEPEHAYKNNHFGRCEWPNFIVDATEYSYCRQSSTLQAAAELDKLASHMRDTSKTAAFWDRFHSTFDYAHLCIHRNPRQRTVGYNLYLHAVSGHCTTLDDGDNRVVGEFIFCDTRSGERAIRFADLVEGDHDTVDSTVACVPVHERPTLSGADMVHIDRVTNLEPYSPLPPVSQATLDDAGNNLVEFKHAAVGKTYYDVYVRDQHWAVVQPSFTAWIQQHKDLTHTTRRVPIYDDAVQWHVRIYCSSSD